MKFFFIFTVFLLLTACQSSLIQTNSSYLEPAIHPSIEITQSLDVSPESARAFLQNGEVISLEKLDLYAVNCEVEVNTVSETGQIIKPGKFKIISTSYEESPIVMIKPVMLASLNYASSTPPDIKRYVRFHLTALEAESKSSVRSLICRGAQDTHNEAELPTLKQMQNAVGIYIKFNL